MKANVHEHARTHRGVRRARFGTTLRTHAHVRVLVQTCPNTVSFCKPFDLKLSADALSITQTSFSLEATSSENPTLLHRPQGTPKDSEGLPKALSGDSRRALSQRAPKDSQRLSGAQGLPGTFRGPSLRALPGDPLRELPGTPREALSGVSGHSPYK